MIKDQIVALLKEAIGRAQEKGQMPAVELPEIPLERPANPAFGDYASSLAMRLARSARMNPLAIAKKIVDNLPAAAFLERVEVAPPGFVNFSLKNEWIRQQVETILAAGPRFGAVDLGRGTTVQLEFGSANPTGPLTAALGRAVSLGDALGNILAAAGYRVTREYYVNDAGSRMDAFYQTAYARYLQAFGRPAEVPEDGYHGSYMVDLAAELKAEYGDRFLNVPAGEAAVAIGHIALAKMIASAEADLAFMGVHHDVWFREQSLFDAGLVAQTISLLEARGYISRREGAIWFTSSALGEDKDNVLVRSNGVPTYFASDIAYHNDKFVQRGFQWVVDIWGADHQGHVPRMKAAVAALGVDPDRLTVILHQLVTLMKDGRPYRISKRTGNLVTLRELLDEVGPDACRFFFLMRSADSQMEFDLDLAKEQSEENPVFYVQYAHARIASILRRAQERDLQFAGGDVALLAEAPELTLIRKMLELPELVENTARLLEPHHLPYYARDLAAVFSAFYRDCRVINDDPALAGLTKARLKLVRAAQIVLANSLRLMGVAAPEQM